MTNIAALKETLKQLHANLETTGEVDAELKELLRVLDNDIQQLLKHDEETAPKEEMSGDASPASELSERAQSLSAKFAAQHPHLEPVLREFMDSLSRMGI
jgi:Domain of unknown function (DUF4404)